MANPADVPPEQSKASVAAADKKPMSTLVSARVWEIYSPPPMNSFKGALVPRAFQKRGRRRKISVEVHRVQVPGKQEDLAFEECIVRVLDPANKQVMNAAMKRGKERHKHQDTINAAVSVLPSASGGDEGTATMIDDDEMSVGSTVAAAYLDAGSSDYAVTDFDKGWKAKYRFPVNALQIKGTHKTGVEIHLKLGKISQNRELVFDNIEEAEDFRSVIEQELKLEEQRSDDKLQATLGGLKIEANEKITFLIEIVSAWDIMAGDFYTSDPYVACLFDGKEIHRTKFIPKTLDPIWTLKTGSLFLMEVDTKDLFLSEGLLCLIYDFDKVGKNEKLGAVYIPPKTLYEAKGERMEFKVGPAPGETEGTGYLAVRCRRATEYDTNFLKDYNGGKKSTLDYLGFKKTSKHATDSKGGASNLKSLLSRNTKVEKDGKHPGVKQYKIRPEPDPNHVEETTWMTQELIDKATLEDSHNWVDTGSGKLGRVFVEIMGCDDLPNLDSGGFAGNKTDGFVSLVYEDATVRTDIIDDTLKPRWLPWSKRAFIFHMLHSSSQLFLGVFDYDDGINPADDHDLIGRVSVDLSGLRKDTTYMLKYNIYDTARMTQRKRRGSITLRVRLEIEDDRKLLLSNLEPPPQMYVNVKTRKDFRVIRYTCTGKYDMDKYNMKVINSYIEELLELQHILFYLQDAAETLLLWRGTLELPFFGKTFMIPVHSASAFLSAILLVEHPQMFPSFCFAMWAWVLLATMDYRRTLPDIWSRCKPFREFLETLALGEATNPPPTIKRNQNLEAAIAFREKYQHRIEKAERDAMAAYEESAKAQEEYDKEMEEIGDDNTDIATKRGGVSIDPFKSILFPVQQNLAIACRYLRHAKYIIFWEECYISFWITTGCLLVSFIFMFVPWAFLIKWTTRLLVWTLFGPWMKLVDVYYVSKIKDRTEEELAEQIQQNRVERRLATTAAVSEARMKREDASKLKAMKKHMFGKYITRVPILKEDRYRDMPLPESSATPYRPVPLPLSELAMQEAGYHRTRLAGQHLIGNMIPKVESEGFTQAPIGQATAHPNLLDKDGPGGSLKATSESTAGAYAKIGSLVVVAAILTWLGVPVLAAMTEKVLHLY